MPITLSRTRTRTVAIGAAAALAGGVGLSAVLASPAEAIPPAQQNCVEAAAATNVPANGWQPVNNMAVTIDNGQVGRLVVVNLNADAGVTSGAEIRMGYRIDGGAVQTPGAQNFANHTEYWQTRHSMVVLRVPAGAHVIRPFWRISGPAGTSGVISSRCVTVEAYTS
jgi:hypothetical protein